MNRKLVALNLSLLFLAIALGLQFRNHWQETKQQESEVISRTKAVNGSVQTPAAVPQVPPTPAANYFGVAAQTLFSADRNPTRIVDPPPPPPVPPPPPPEPPVPAMPVYHGQMMFGDPVIVMSYGTGAQKGYRVGEKIGEFNIAKFDHDSVTLEWRDKVLVRDLASLAPPAGAPKQIAAAAPQAGARAPVAAAPARSNASGDNSFGSRAAADVSASKSNVSQMGGSKNADGTAKTEPVYGSEFGEGRSCVGSDTSPAGTVSNGFRKVISNGLMGNVCFWEPVK